MNAEQIKTKTINWLIKGNLSFNVAQDAIATEVLFSANKRKADLLVLSREIHTLEIKSDFDNTDKLRNQLTDYHKTFDKVSVIVTAKHFNKIKKIVTPNTGLILFEKEKFQIIRTAKKNKKLDKYSLLMFLPKNELIKTYKIWNYRSLSTDQIRKKLTNQLTINKAHSLAISFLRNRYNKLFTLFLKDTDGKIVWDELRGLSGEINKLYA